MFGDSREEAAGSQSIAPGKIILTGEHAVLYGARARACALARYTKIVETEAKGARLGAPSRFELAAPVFFEEKSYAIDELARLVAKLDKRYEAFEQGLLRASHILEHPRELLVYAYAIASRALEVEPARLAGTRLEASTELFVGAGMGSSASVIAATVRLVEARVGKELSREDRIALVRYIERLQHGRGSMLDAASVCAGGVVQLSDARIIYEEASFAAALTDENQAFGWYLLYTGRPISTTGDCVAAVREGYAQERAIWQECDQIGEAFVDGLADHRLMRELLRANHAILTHIGVVPEAAQRLIAMIESKGGAAKISGAGSLEGAATGMVLAYMERETFAAVMAYLADKMPGYVQSTQTLSIDTLGARIC